MLHFYCSASLNRHFLLDLLYILMRICLFAVLFNLLYIHNYGVARFGRLECRLHNEEHASYLAVLDELLTLAVDSCRIITVEIVNVGGGSFYLVKRGIAHLASYVCYFYIHLRTNLNFIFNNYTIKMAKEQACHKKFAPLSCKYSVNKLLCKSCRSAAALKCKTLGKQIKLIRRHIYAVFIG